MMLLGVCGKCRVMFCRNETKRYVSGPKKTESEDAGKDE
jgi:hypothetical protein